MLTFPSALKIYLAIEPVDMRKQFNGLWSQAGGAKRGHVVGFGVDRAER
jgi:hypothetical protein